MDRLERMNFTLAKSDLNLLVRSAVDRFRMTAAERRLSLTYDLEGESLIVTADAVELEKAIVALIDNAVRYTAAGGYVMVTTRTEPDVLVLEVKDTGRGIDPNHLPHIFDRFYRADQARPSNAGVGLGLAKVRIIIEAHRGRIDVESRVGEGSTFRVILPFFSL
jgi:signal transduction histidine kinase